MAKQSWMQPLIAIGILLAPFISAAVEVEMSGEESFKKASLVLVELGAIPTFRDKELLVIKTDPVPVQLTTEQADCGSMFGIPYLKDKRTKTAAAYQIVIKSTGDATSDVTVKVALDGYMDVNEGAPFFIEKTRDTSKTLTCTSKGVLEAKFIELFQAP